MAKPLVTREALRKEREKQAQALEMQKREADKEFSKREREMYDYYRKKRKQTAKAQPKSNRTVEQTKAKERKSFLNKALFIVIILLALLIFAIWRL